MAEKPAEDDDAGSTTPNDESGRELPDREGTYDELREAATKEEREGAQDE